MSGRGGDREQTSQKNRNNRNRGGQRNNNNNNNSNGGRGRGRGRGRNQPNRNASRNKTPPTNILQNGQKGAEAHTVPESTRIHFTSILSHFREDPTKESLEMPTDLTNTERKFLHLLAMQLGLKSKSTGKGTDRRIVIRKHGNAKIVAGIDPNLDTQELTQEDQQQLLPLLEIGSKGSTALRNYLQMFPPNQVELKEAQETGSSLGHDNDASNVLKQLGIKDVESNISRANQKSKRQVDLERRAALHQRAQAKKIQQKGYSQMLAGRKKLPTFAHQDEIVNILRNNRVTILSGETGSGKSTQVPQFILDNDPFCNIVVTQPRRISAISIAERVSTERCETVGTVVGYNVRLESAISESTQLTFCTPGILLRKFQNSPDLEEYNYIMLDEIHERDQYTEFVMIALKELMTRRKDLHVVLMSATIQTDELKEYWSSVGNSIDDEDYMPAEVCVPGRTFPVQSFFLEDVLNITGFVSNHDGGMQDFEKDLASLLSTKDPTSKKNKQQNIRKGGKKEVVDTIVMGAASYTCVMCNQTGFKCAEELGSHMGVCTGLPNMDMLSLEEKVKNTNVLTRLGSIHDSEISEDIDESEIIFDEDYEIDESENEEDDDGELFGMHDGKWDGESPFAVADVVSSSSKVTLTDEETLNRYQMMHDDEEIDSDLILELIRYIIKASYLDGAILVFLPGWQEITELLLLLESTHPFSDKSRFSILPLHSGIPSKEQRVVFQRPPKGVRKIVLSTNIAETSVTIDDVAFVIDSGRAKEKNYDVYQKTSTLQPMWISQASAKQRRGRAGRTKAGVCFHLFSRRRHESFREFLESELLRTSLEEICLQCKKLKLAPGGLEEDDGIAAFLARALTPPHPKSVINAIEKLVELGAMDMESNDLTHLGHCLSCLSVSPEVGKMVIWSYLLGCSRSVSWMAVAMSYKSPFIIPPTHMRRKADDAKVRICEKTESDQVALLKVLRARDKYYKQNRGNQFYSYCRDNFINVPTIQMISELRKNIARELSSCGFTEPGVMNSWHTRNENGNNLCYLQSAIAAGVYPNIASRHSGAVNFSTSTNRKTKIHMSSVNSVKGQPLSKKANMLEFMVYGEMVKGKAMYTCSQTTYLHSILPVILFCGQFCIQGAVGRSNNDKAIITIDEWISFQCEKETSIGLAVIRKRLGFIFNHIVSNPSLGLDGLSKMERETLNVVDLVLQSAHNEAPKRI